MAWVLDENTVNVIVEYRTPANVMRCEGTAVNGSFQQRIDADLVYASNKTLGAANTEAIAALNAKLPT